MRKSSACTTALGPGISAFMLAGHGHENGRRGTATNRQTGHWY